jgi:hypothetical protein
VAEAAHGEGDSSVAKFPSFYAIKLAKVNVSGRKIGLIRVEINSGYGMVFRFVSGGLLVFGNPKTPRRTNLTLSCSAVCGEIPQFIMNQNGLCASD